MGNPIQVIADNVRLVASGRNWIEGDAIEQLKHVSRLPNMAEVVGLPDLHPGRGYPIGAACLSPDTLYPALVGNDIGCGMALYATDAAARKVKHDKWEKALRQKAFIDQADWSDEGSRRLADKVEQQGAGIEENMDGALLQSCAHSFGTIGGGNHFAEFQSVKTIHDAALFEEQGLSRGIVYLLVHSGSRGLGQKILRGHVDQYGHAGLDVTTAAAAHYLSRHNLALRWAEVNRELIAARICAALGLDARQVLDINHNLVEPYTAAAQSGWLHRKGVTPADQGMVMIPGSRGSASYLVQPLPSPLSLSSLAHGAGRKWVRTECAGRLKSKYQLRELQRTALGSRVICDDKALMYEEAPEAYKSIDIVVSDLVDAGLCRLIAEFVPVMTYKTADQERCCK